MISKVKAFAVPTFERPATRKLPRIVRCSHCKLIAPRRRAAAGRLRCTRCGAEYPKGLSR